MQKPDISLHKSDQPYRVGIWPVPGFAMMSFASVVEPLRAANLMADDILFETLIFGAGDQVTSSGPGTVRVDHPMGSVPEMDLFLVVAGGDPFAITGPAELAWLRQLSRSGVTMGGVSGGAVVLAAAGLMSGRRLTVHWEHAPELSEQHPDLWIQKRLYVMDQDRMTCGGGTAPMDMMHALIAQRHGAAFARLVSDWFLHTEVRTAAAPQRGSNAEQLMGAPEPVTEAIAVMEDHISDPLSLPQLALITGVSARHLNRMFNATLGTTASQHYRNLRLQTAQNLVRRSGMSMRAISEATGFSSVSHLSNAYSEHFGHSPTADRPRSLDVTGAHP